MAAFIKFDNYRGQMLFSCNRVTLMCNFTYILHKKLSVNVAQEFEILVGNAIGPYVEKSTRY